MNILMINYEYPPLGAGAGRQSQLLAEELSKRHRVIVLTSTFKGLPRKEAKNENLLIRRVPVLRRFKHRAFPIEMALFLLFGFFTSRKIVREENIDISIAFFTTPCGYISVRLKRLFRIPYIISLRGFDVPGFFSGDFGFLQRLNLPFIKIAWKHADGIVANSNTLADLAKKTVEELNIIVIPNAVVQEAISRQSLSEEVASGAVRILVVGRLTRQKGIENLIEALALLKKEENFILDIAGDGPLKTMLAERVRSYGMDSKVIFHGWLGREALTALYNRTDIFVLLSLEEGMSNVLLEALSFGLPIIATDIPANRELVKDGINGFLVPGDDPKATAEKLAILIGDKKLRDKFSIENNRLAAHFAPDKMAYSYENLCVAILKRGEAARL